MCIVCPTRRLASTERAHAQLNLNASGTIFPRYSPKPYRGDFRKGRYCIIIISIPTRRRCCTRNTDRDLYLPHTCVSAFTSVNLPEYIPTRPGSVRPRPQLFVTHVTSKSWSFCKFVAPTANSWKIKNKFMVICVKHFSIFQKY